MILTALLALPFVATAQDQEVLWELSKENYLDVTDLGFRFYYPVGWVWDANSDRGIAIGATQDDVDAHLDGDDSTLPTGQIITILGVPLSALEEAGDNLKMDQLANLVVELGEITETERVEVPIMARRSISVVGENSQGRSGIGTLWTQNGYLVIASLGVPDQETVNSLAYTWGVTIGTMEPLNAEELGSKALASDVSQFTMNYPDGWTGDPQQPELVVYELADDIGAEFVDMEGIQLSVIDGPLTDLGFEADTTVDDLATEMGDTFGLNETATQEEFLFLEQPAVVSVGEIGDSSGGKRGLILTSSVVGESAVVFVLLAPSLERAEEFVPTWVKMMQSVTNTAA